MDNSIIQYFYELCQTENLTQLKELYNRNDFHPEDLNKGFCIVCDLNNVEIAKWFRSLGVNLDCYNMYAFNFSLQNNRLEILKWLIDINPESRLMYLKLAAHKARLDIVKYIFRYLVEFDIKEFSSVYTDVHQYLFKMTCLIEKYKALVIL